MICLSNSNEQVIPAGQSVTFDVIILHTGRAECYRPNSGVVNLLAKNAIYEVEFNGNVSSETAGDQVQLVISYNGSPLLETTMISTITAAGDINNVSTSTLVKTCCCSAGSITVTNTGTTSVTLESNPCLKIKRDA